MAGISLYRFRAGTANPNSEPVRFSFGSRLVAAMSYNSVTLFSGNGRL